jgi:hypothetical protein
MAAPLTLFLHSDWTRLSRSGSEDHDKLALDAHVVIPLSPSRPLPFLPFLLFLSCLHVASYGAYRVTSVIGWTIVYGDSEGGRAHFPCFLASSDERIWAAERFLRLWFVGLTVVEALTMALIFARGGLLRSAARFFVWWCRRNYEVTFWTVARAVLVTVGVSSMVPTAISSVLFLAIVAGYDLFIMMNGKAPWLLRVYRTLYAVNFVAMFLGYAAITMSKNECGIEKHQHQSGLISVLATIATAGQMRSLLKIDVLKMRRIFHPALRYGIWSHVVVSLPGPGETVALVLAKGQITLVPDGDHLLLEGKVFTFRMPAEAFRSRMFVGACFGFGIVLGFIMDHIVDLTLFKVNLAARCWTWRTDPSYAHIWKLALTSLGLLFTAWLVGLVLFHGLARVTIVWIRYWARRNWVLVSLFLLVALQGLGAGVGLAKGITFLANMAIVIPLLLCVTDFLLLLQQRAAFVLLYRSFVVLQIVAFAALYVRALAEDSPCESMIKETGPISITSFVLEKLRVTSLLFLSLHFISLIVTIKVGNVAMPIINFSERDRFSEGSSLPKHEVGRVSAGSREWLLSELHE